MNSISVIKLMPETKAQQQTFANQLLQSVLNGEINPIDMDILLKSIEETIKIVRSNDKFKDYLIDEMYKYSEKTIDFATCEITKTSRVIFNYAEDSVYSELKDKLKAREDLLKLAFKQPVVDGETGEQVEPVTRKESEYLRYKFK